ncbi:SNARE-like domain protein [Leptospira perolatii]|uniref:SNARE-like domain protein n=1 Tax=Leptospira perolatii TaxID=2023191 RepID=A0A2M9ZPT6_9LEPT|nr:SNARE-like domain protein [Leptospira perolatii]PJZ74076.1 SNARE-like domain protein [Leptospira perolatii]
MLEIISKVNLEYGNWGLLFLSFAGATLLPFSSEVALVFAIWMGTPRDEALLFASIGNCSACLVNYYIGYWFRGKVESKIATSKIYSVWVSKMEVYGYPVLGLSFLPIIGDPITVISGFFRQKLIVFVLIVFTLRILRYVALAYGLG